MFGQDLDFSIIKNCTQTDANHTIGAKHIKRLAEDGLVKMKFDHEARSGAAEIIGWHV